MYEQSAMSLKPDDEKLMNMAVDGQKDKDIQDVKQLQESTAGSLFLKSATKTTEDMLRKLREDPLFQIRRQEQAARENMMANPLVVAKMKKKAEKQAKKDLKKAKKAAKKEKKAQKKAKKKEAKAMGIKRKASSSSSSSDSSAAPAAATATAASTAASSGKSDQVLGPSGHVVDKREEREAEIRRRRDAALASRGATRRMDEDERRRRVEEMQSDAKRHEMSKDARIAAAEKREQEIEETEKRMRQNSDQKYFKEMRAQAYMGDEGSLADRMKNQRHRRQKNLNDPLERDG